LLFALAAVIVDAKPVDPSIKINCIIKHLKASKMLEESYPRYPGLSIDDCAELIEEGTQVTFQSVISGLRMKNLQKHKDCVVSSLKANKWPENNFLLIVYSSSDTLSADERTAKEQEIIRKNTEISMKAFGSCVFSDIFSTLFDRIIASSANDDDTDPIQKYCDRKHVFDNHLIDSSYSIVMNPDNVDVSAANCEEYLEKTKNEAEKSIVDKLSKQFSRDGSITCAKEKFKQLGFVDKIMGVVVLGETQLSDEQRQTEKKKFVDMMTNAVDEVGKCKA